MAQNSGTSYGTARKLGQAKSREMTLVTNYKMAYRSREDVTMLPPGVLIKGSQNVLTNVSERVQIRQGYALDGATSVVASPIIASFDWKTRGNGEKNLRAGFLTSAGNDGKLQYRYVDGSGTVTWRDLLTSLTTVSYNFCTFWNRTENDRGGGVHLGLREVVFVNGSSQIQMWNGAVTTLLSATATTITKSGTTSWRDSGFYNVNNKQIVINGTTYTYTGGESTTTLTGVTADPSAEPVGSVIHQAVVTIAFSSFTGLSAPPSTFTANLISILNNQIYLASTNSSAIYVGNQNSTTNSTGVITNFDQSAPRQAQEGSSAILDDNIVGFIVQGSTDAPTMYVSVGNDLWYKNLMENYVDVTGSSGQTFTWCLLKSGRQQGAISQAFISSMKNNTITVTNETTIDMIGVMENFLTQVQTTNISDSIKLDVDDYDFTDGSIFYHRYYIYVAVPKEGIVLIYNLATKSWEAPQTLPVSRFYIVGGELYGHSYQTSESYKLFTGYADRVYTGFAGYPIEAKWVFSYQNFGTRSYQKKANSFYIEGYVTPNTTINAYITYELDGCAIVKSFIIDGSDRQIVCIPSENDSLGKNSLGKQKLGGKANNQNNFYGLPPKFRVEKTFSNTDFFECSISFDVFGTDNRFELLAFGLNAGVSTQEPIQIRQ